MSRLPELANPHRQADQRKYLILIMMPTGRLRQRQNPRMRVGFAQT